MPIPAHTPSHQSRTYTLREAAARCGYRRPNTMREKFLATKTQRQRLGHRVVNGVAFLDADAVDALALQVEAERAARGDWRVKNLGRYARKRRRRSPAARGGRPPERCRDRSCDP